MIYGICGPKDKYGSTRKAQLVSFFFVKSAQLCSTIRIFLDLFQDLTDIILLVVVNVSVDSEVSMVLH